MLRTEPPRGNGGIETTQRRELLDAPGPENFLDLHHIELRSEGGSNHTDNLISVCATHHRALHRGEL